MLILLNRALEIPPTATPAARNDLDPDFTGYVPYGKFLPYASSHINLGGQSPSAEEDDGAHMQEVQSAYDLFTLNGPGPISIAHLRRVARQLKENVTDEQLANMVKVANGRTSEKNGWQAGVTLGEFEKVMDEAGVWRR
jgi:Ca2+-binding EF-hand superfamily protein